MKREPVAVYTALVAALTALLAIPDLGEHISPGVRFWLGVALAVLIAVGGVLVRGQTTSLAEPTARDGRPLVPSPPAEVPPRTPPAALDATEQ